MILSRALLPGLILAAAGYSLTVQADPGMRERVYTAMYARDRQEQDVFRDFDRKPLDVLEFAGIGAGMTVLELMAGSGYYTELLAAAVGPEGRVYAHNDVMALRMRQGAIQKAMDQRLRGGRLPNVTPWAEDAADLGLHETIDVATVILNLHDLYIFGGEERVLAVLASVMEALKPGGTLLIVDHAGDPTRNNTSLHRIDLRVAENLLLRAGFLISAHSDLLSNPYDGRDLHVFDPEIRGRTSRFLLRAMRPQ